MGGLKISIVVRTYNRNKFLKEALSSISNQPYNNWELILFDDMGSYENFNSFLNFKKTHSDNRCIYVTSATSYEFFKDSWISGIDLATGDICIRLDDDDLLLPHTLTYINQLYNENADLDFTYGSSLSFNEDGSIEKGITGKTPFENSSKNLWKPYSLPNNHPWKREYYWVNDYYEHPKEFTSIIHASRANILCIYHLYTFKIQSVKKVMGGISITSTLCDDLEFFASMDYLGLSHNSIKSSMILSRNHSVSRVTQSTNKSQSGLSWWDEIERVRCKVDELRCSGFVSNVIPIHYPEHDEINKELITKWISQLKVEALKF